MTRDYYLGYRVSRGITSPRYFSIISSVNLQCQAMIDTSLLGT